MIHANGNLVATEYTCKIVYNNTCCEIKTRRLNQIIKYLEKKKETIKYYIPDNYKECCISCYIYADTRTQFDKYVKYFKGYGSAK